MQSCQMRWPVAGHIGLSTMIMASAPSVCPSRFQAMHLRDFFVERAAGEDDAEWILFEAFVRLALFSGKPFGAEIAIVIVAVDAVVDLVLHRARGHARIGQGKTVAPAPVARRALSTGMAIVCDRDDRDQVGVIARARQQEAHPAAGGAWPSLTVEGAEAPAHKFFQLHRYWLSHQPAAARHNGRWRVHGPGYQVLRPRHCASLRRS